MRRLFPKNKLKAFTLLELLIVIAVFGVIVVTGFTFRGAALGDTILSTQVHKVTESIKLAQIKSITRYKNSQWGVYFNHNANSPDQYVIFKGTTYSTRDPAYDLINVLPDILTFTTINLNGGGTEVTFTKTNGQTSQYGSIMITSSQGPQSTITVNPKGVVDFM